MLLVANLFIFTACGKNDLKGGKSESNSNFRFAMGNSDVPVGQYTQQILAFYGIDEELIKDHISYGSNAKEATTAISEGLVDCGVVYETDACQANLKIVDYANEEMCGQVLYPAAIIKDSQNRIAAEHFLQYLQTTAAGDVFRKSGFEPIAVDTQISEKINAKVQDFSADNGEVIVFAAASLTETLADIFTEYEKLVPGIKLIFNLDSSGTLKTQIKEGASCDIFISAAQKQMDELDETCNEEKNPERLDLIDSATRIDLLENKVVLCVSEKTPYEIDSFEALAKMLKE